MKSDGPIARASGARRLRVLLLGDEGEPSLWRVMLRCAAKDEGWSLQRASSADDRADELSHDVDVVVVARADARPAEKIATLRRIFDDAALVLCTSEDDERAADAFMDLGVDDCLPVAQADEAALLRVVRRAARRRAADARRVRDHTSPESARGSAEIPAPALPRAIDPDIGLLVPRFLRNRQSDLRRIRAALDDGDRQSIARMAHHLRVTAIAYGLDTLSRLGAELESALAAVDEVAVRRALDSLQHTLHRLIAEHAAIPTESGTFLVTDDVRMRQRNA